MSKSDLKISAGLARQIVKVFGNFEKKSDLASLDNHQLFLLAALLLVPGKDWRELRIEKIWHRIKKGFDAEIPNDFAETVFTEEERGVLLKIRDKRKFSLVEDFTRFIRAEGVAHVGYAMKHITRRGYSIREARIFLELFKHYHAPACGIHFKGKTETNFRWIISERVLSGERKKILKGTSSSSD